MAKPYDLVLCRRLRVMLESCASRLTLLKYPYYSSSAEHTICDVLKCRLYVLLITTVLRTGLDGRNVTVYHKGSIIAA